MRWKTEWIVKVPIGSWELFFSEQHPRLESREADRAAFP
jgi:hypothetical protein